MKFSKYHGAGNDFILLDLRGGKDEPPNLDAFAERICNRRLGVGADGVLLLTDPPDDSEADVTMRTINSDGSEAEMCGNGLRCLVKHVLDGESASTSKLRVLTLAGLRSCAGMRGVSGNVESVTISMGKPILERGEIPLAGEGSGIREKIAHPGGEELAFTAVSMGNPHAVIFLDGDDDPGELARRLGPGFETHERFPKRANISFVTAHPARAGKRPHAYQVVVWERGAGLTAACGTGASAVAVAACLEERAGTGELMEMHLPGGRLDVEVGAELDDVRLTGPARQVYEGEIEVDQLPSLEACRALVAATR